VKHSGVRAGDAEDAAVSPSIFFFFWQIWAKFVQI